jgi:hypothetical protein
MDETTKEQIKKQFDALPIDIQNAITSVGLTSALRDVSKRFNLNETQINVLENETLFVMLGLEHPSDYIGNLVRESKMNEATVRQIAKEVNEQVFRPIRHSLKEVHGLASAEQHGQTTSSEGGQTPLQPVAKATQPQHAQKQFTEKSNLDIPEAGVPARPVASEPAPQVEARPVQSVSTPTTEPTLQETEEDTDRDVALQELEDHVNDRVPPPQTIPRDPYRERVE